MDSLFLKTTGSLGLIYPLFQDNTEEFASAMVVAAILVAIGFVKGEPLGGTSTKNIDDD